MVANCCNFWDMRECEGARFFKTVKMEDEQGSTLIIPSDKFTGSTFYVPKCMKGYEITNRSDFPLTIALPQGTVILSKGKTLTI